MAAYLQMGEASKAAYTAAPKRTPTKPLKYIFEIRLGIPHFLHFSKGGTKPAGDFLFPLATVPTLGQKPTFYPEITKNFMFENVNFVKIEILKM